MVTKKLCKLIKKEFLKTNLDDYILLVKKPKYICSKCGRTAIEKERLCDPKKIDKK